MAMPRRRGAAEILLRISVGGGACFGAELALDDLPGVWALHAAHAVVHHAEVRSGDHGLDLIKVEAFLQEREVVLHAVKDFYDLVADAVRDGRSQVQGWKLAANLVLGDLGSPGNHQVRHLLRRRAAVLAVVLDAEVVVDAARIVRSGADEATEGHEALAMAPDDRRGRRRGQKSASSAPYGAHTVREGHLDDDLDRLTVPITSVAADDKGTALDGNFHVLQRVEDALYVVGQIVLSHEDLGLLPEARRPRLLPVDRLRGDGGDREVRVDGRHVFCQRAFPSESLSALLPQL
mmetsp:Transcript_4609/g.13026  ORF Transcript_4609/g.13026 Transcript_4609/m.13026 type:complete len:292 (+) Transcript_4609:1395-2270(+)